MGRRRGSKKKVNKIIKRILNNSDVDWEQIRLVERYVNGTLRELYGCSEKELLEFQNIQNSEPKYEIRNAVVNALTQFDKQYSSLSGLENIVTLNSEWIHSLEHHILSQRVRATNFNEPKAVELLKDHGAKYEGEGTENYNLEGFLGLQAVVELAEKSEFQFSELQQAIQMLHKELKEVYGERKNMHGTQLYAEIISDRIKNNIIYQGALKFKWVIKHAMEEPLTITNVLKSAEKERELCENIDSEYLAELVNVLDESDVDLIDILTFIGNTKEKLDVHEGKKYFPELVRAVPIDDRFDLVIKLAEESLNVTVYSEMRKLIPKEKFVEYIQTMRNYAVEFNNENVHYSSVIESIVKNRQYKTAKIFIERAEEILSDPQSEQLFKIAIGVPNIELILTDYLNAREAGRNNVADTYLYIAKCRPDGAELKGVRPLLNLVHDEGLTWVIEDMPFPSFSRRLGRELKKQSGSNTTTSQLSQRKKEKNGSQWYHELIMEAEKVFSQEQIGNIKSARDRLGESSKKLYHTWKNNRSSFLPFVEHAVEYHQNETFQLLLHNPLLFNEYIQRLGADSLDDGIVTLFENPQGNVYSQLRSALLPGSIELPVQEKPPTLGEEISLDLKSTNRILIWGGQYSTDAKKEIHAAAGLPTEIYDINNKKGDPSIVKEGDMVICCTNSFKHGIYYSLKKKCTRTGARLYHHSGAATSLTNLLNNASK